MKKISEKDLINFLEKEFPLSKAEEWDFVGYSLKFEKSNISKILLCLDVNTFSVDKAIEKKVDLIISFHPFCFANTWEEIYEYDFTKKELVKKLSENEIGVYSIHTNFEQHKKGTLYWMLKLLGLENNEIKKFKFSSIFKYNESFISLVERIKNNFKINCVLTNYPKSYDSNISNVYISPGAGDIYEFLKINKNENVDLLITSDIKWNEQQLLNSNKINFLIIPHKTEDVFVEGISNIIREKFESIELELFLMDDFVKVI